MDTNKDADINSLEEEKIRIYNQVCQCYSQCLSLNPTDKYKLRKEAPICNKIILENLSVDNSIILINKSFKYLMSNKYIKAIGTEENHKYYITLDKSTIKFNWDNIKTLKSDVKEIKELFWLFRKLIVDNLLKIIITEYSIVDKRYLDVKIYSVGSTDITSDYDITLYSDYSNIISNIIRNFEERFIKIFGEHSSIIFDTNIYGKAYIVFNNNYNYSEIDKSKCVNQKETLYYINSLNDSKYKYTQVIWSLIKYLRNIRESFGEQIYNKYFNFLKTHCKNNIVLDITQETLIFLKNINTSYSSLIEEEEIHHDKYISENLSTLLFNNDYISLINFYGEETYFTRGAFLDTVVNSQMCNNYQAITLYEEDYIASIFENAGFYFLHNDKTKYLKRVKTSLILLSNINKDYKEIIKSTLFNNLQTVTDNNYDYCNWIDDNDFNILKCEKYEMFQVLFKIIYKILETYLDKINFIGFPFHSLYIKEQIVNLTSPIQQNFIPSFIEDIKELKRNSINHPNTSVFEIKHRIRSNTISSLKTDKFLSRTRGNTII